jgi:hypothetical protein
MKLVDLVPLKEGSMQARELADYNSLEELQAMYDQLMRDMEQEAEPEGGPIADQYADQMHDIEQAMQIKRGKTKDVPYDVAIGRMSRDEFEKSSKFDRNLSEVDSEPDYEWEKGSKAGPGNPAYDAAREKAKQDTRVTVDGKEVDTSSIEMGGLEMMRRYGPDDGGPDAYIEYAEFIDGTELTDVQIDEFMDKYPDITHEKALDQMFQQEGAVDEGSCGYGPKGIPGDTPGETKGMDADDRTRGMLKMLIKKEIAKLNENKRIKKIN